MSLSNRITIPALATGVLMLTACTTTPAPAATLPHVIAIGGTAPMVDIDTCIDDAFTNMTGQWHMRFAATGTDGNVSRDEGHLTIAPKSFGRWTILRPDAAGTMTPFSIITNYGDGQLESVRLTPASNTIFEETYLECHAPDESGRTKFVSTLDETQAATGTIMRTTRTGWVSPTDLYSIDIIEAAGGASPYAISTRFGERVGE